MPIVYFHGTQPIYQGGELNDIFNPDAYFRNAVSTLRGGKGDDTYYLLDNMNGYIDVVVEFDGEGNDTIITDFNINLSYTDPYFGGTPGYAHIENVTLYNYGSEVTGNARNNIITGNYYGNFLDGRAGNDVIYGGDGYDTLYGGDGNDILNGGNGGGLLNGGAGNDAMTGGDGTDYYYVDSPGDTATDFADGGYDFVYADLAGGQTFTLSAFIEQLELWGNANSNGAGNALGNSIFGNQGNNTLAGLAGDDGLYGQSGNDTLQGGDGSDSLFGGEGNDVLDGGAGDDYLEGNDGDDAVQGGDGTDNLYGQQGKDTLAGGAGNDNLDGGEGNDSLDGGAGNDFLFGDSGNDTLAGGDGNDYLNGGAGVDALNGGAGDDSYQVEINDGDTITDAGGDDTIQLLGFGGTYTMAAGIENLVWNGGGGPMMVMPMANAIQALTIIGNTSNNVILGGSDYEIYYGGAGNDTIDGRGGGDTMYGGAGNDSYLVENFFDRVFETAAADGTDAVLSGIDYVLGANLENLVLGGRASWGRGNALNNVITGSSNSDLLEGLAGNDTLDGGYGGDVLNGGAGNDTYIIDSYFDAVIELGGVANEIDTVRSYLQETHLGSNVENLVLLYSFGAAGYGNALANTITGSGEGDYIDGGAGKDTLIGGGGNETYVVDGAGAANHDVVTEAAGGGNDSVQFMGTGIYTLAANVENVQILPGAGNAGATGNTQDNVMEGNAGSNALNGGAGNDILYGGAGSDTLTGDVGNDTLYGGTGNDAMNGGAGDDTYYVDNALDTVADTGGVDTVFSKRFLDLSVGGMGTNVIENLVLMAAAFNGTGNTLNNVITGNALANILLGREGNDTLLGYGGNDLLDGGAGNDILNGGDGNDRMYGGAGNDTYIVQYGDIIANELATAGEIDTVVSASGWTLFDNENLENLTLNGNNNAYGQGNTAANVITGDDSANSLYGDGGNDTLAGGGGNDWLFGNAGDDTLNGGAGDDQLHGDDDGAGNDTLNGGAGVDYLFGGAGNDVLNGGDDFDLLYGGAGNDTLNGGNGGGILNGEAGNDAMTGGTGGDQYYVDSPLDTATDVANGGYDTVYATLANAQTFTLSPFIEQLQLWGNFNSNGTGNALDNQIYGNSGNNILSGLDGNDILHSYEGSDTLLGGNGNDILYSYNGNDAMYGGAGDDDYYMEEGDGAGPNPAAGEDNVIEAAGGGNDTVRYYGPTGYFLTDNVENLEIGGVGMIFTGGGNALGNTISLGMNAFSGFDITAGGGNDTVNVSNSLHGSFNGDGSTPSGAFGVAGTADLLRASLVDYFDAPTISGFERLDLDVHGMGSTLFVNQLTGAPVITVSGGDGGGLALNSLNSANSGVGIGTLFVDQFNGALDLNSGALITQTVDLAGANLTALRWQNLSTLNLISHAGEPGGYEENFASLANRGSNPDPATKINISGDTNLTLHNLNDNDTVAVANFGAEDLTLRAFEGGDRLTMGLDNTVTQSLTVQNFDHLTMNLGAGGQAMISDLNTDDHFVDLTVNGGAASRLFLGEVTSDFIYASGFNGTLTLLLDGYDGSANYLLANNVANTGNLHVFANGGDAFYAYMGASLDQNDRLSGGDGFNYLEATLTGNSGGGGGAGGSGGLHLQNFDEIRFTVADAALHAIDGADIVGGYINVQGGDILSTFTIDNFGHGFEGLNAIDFGYQGSVIASQSDSSYGFMAGGNLNDTLTGGAQGSVLYGFGGNDSIDGGGGDDSIRGGLGNDTLTGGDGNDDFVFDTTPSLTNVDTLVDFVSGMDEILLGFNFGGLAYDGNGLAMDSFVLGTLATGEGAQIVYDANSGNLYYDSNGASGGGSTLFANVSAIDPSTGQHVAVAASDFASDII